MRRTISIDHLKVWEDCAPWLAKNKLQAASNIAHDLIIQARLRGYRLTGVESVNTLPDGSIQAVFEAR